jgi:hypothetical protein
VKAVEYVLAADCSAHFHRLSKKRQWRGFVQSAETRIVFGACLLTSGPRAAGFRFLIYATKLSHIYVYREVSIFFVLFFF